MSKPYYNAVDNLEHLYTMNDPAYGAYEFHELILFRDTTDGKLYVGTDSGCSCPSPFESHAFPSDFTEIKSKQDFLDYVKDGPWDRQDVENAVALIP